MVQQVDGPVVLVGHSYGGAVITEAGDLPNVAGLVYVAAFAPDAGESGPRSARERRPPPWKTWPRLGRAPLDQAGKFRESFARTCRPTRRW